MCKRLTVGTFLVLHTKLELDNMRRVGENGTKDGSEDPKSLVDGDRSNFVLPESFRPRTVAGWENATGYGSWRTPAGTESHLVLYRIIATGDFN